MATYYVGSGGSDSNDGLSWANRKLTLNGAEDIPVVAGDTVYVGPGVYREQLTIDVNGSSGSEITYIGDVTGVKTDGVGGIVRITGSDDDASTARSYCIVASTAKNYRTFRGFTFDMASTALVYFYAGTYFTIEDCYFGQSQSTACGLYFDEPGSSLNAAIDRCIFFIGYDAVTFTAASDVTVSGTYLQNCLFIAQGRGGASVYCNNVSGPNVHSSTFIGCYYAVRANSLASSIYVYNSIVTQCYYGLYASASGELIEDYNSIFCNAAGRTNVSAGSNSGFIPYLPQPAMLFDEYRFPWAPFDPSEWSTLRRISSRISPWQTYDDLFGFARAVDQSTKKSRGAIQFLPGERETTTTYDSSTASIKLDDNGVHRIWVPVTGTTGSIKVTIQVYREANYSGSNPRMIVKRPPDYEASVTDTGSASQWNELSATFSLALGSNDYLVIELESRNTATSGSYAVYFDGLVVETI